MKKRTIGLLICLLLMTVAVAWPTSVRAEGLPAVQSSAETVRTIELAQGTNARIIAELNGQIRLNPAFAAGEAISYWKSSNIKTVSVDETGLLTANREGAVTISVKTVSGVRAKVEVKVVDPYKPEKIAFTQSGTLILNKDETLQLSAVMEPATARSELTYSTSNKRYATVDGQGVVTGHAEGTAKITVRTYNGRKATIKIKVVDPYKPEKIAFTQTGTLILNKDETLQLSAVMEPATARSELTYSTSNKRYATVDGQGVVTGHAEGTAKITVRTYNGRKATIKIKVVDPYKPEKIAFTQTGTLILNKDETLQLSAVMEPATARSELTWRSSAAKYAAVNETGVVTGLREGSARITVRTYNGKKATIKIKVVDPYKPENISFAEGKTLTINQGEVVQLKPVMEPATARSELTWSSSKKDWLTVDPFGQVLGHQLGTGKITVRTYNGRKATIEIRVIDPYAPDQVFIDGPETITIETGTTLELSAHMEPATAQGVLNWSSSNSKYLQVQGGGQYVSGGGIANDKFVALRAGTVTVTVKAANGRKDTVKVKVVDPPKIAGDIRECYGMPIGEVRRRLDKPLESALDPNTYYNNYVVMATDPMNRVSLVMMSSEINKVSSRYSLFGVRLGIGKEQADQSLQANGWIPFMEIGNERLYVTETDPEVSMIIGWDESGKISDVMYGDPYAAGFGEQPSAISLSESSIVMKPGEQKQLYVYIAPEGAYTKLIFDGGNAEVATIDDNGMVTAVGPGMTVVRVIAGNGLSHSCSVYVSSPDHYYGDLSVFMGKTHSEAAGQLAAGLHWEKKDTYHYYRMSFANILTDDSGKIVAIMNENTDKIYTIFGVHSGMRKNEAVAILNAAGWKPTAEAPNRELFWVESAVAEELALASGQYPGRIYVRCSRDGLVYNVLYDNRP